jgi:hypothetical protein
VNRAELDVESGATLTVQGNLYSGLNGSNTVNVTGGSALVLKGTMGNPLSSTNGPLTNFKLSDSILTIDLGASANPTAAICTVSNLDLSGLNTLNVQGTALSAGQFPLIQYASMTNPGPAAFAAVNVSAPWQGYLSNNVANFTIDLVLFTAVRMSDVSVISGGHIQFTVNGPDTLFCRILSSTNLADPLGSWSEIGSGNLAGGTMSFIDVNAGNYPRRFYRVVAP